MWCYRNECYTLFGKFRQDYMDTVLAPSDDRLSQLSLGLAVGAFSEEQFFDAQQAYQAETHSSSKKRKLSVEGLGKSMAMSGSATDDSTPSTNPQQRPAQPTALPQTKLVASDPQVVIARTGRRILHWGSDIMAVPQVNPLAWL